MKDLAQSGILRQSSANVNEGENIAQNTYAIHFINTFFHQINQAFEMKLYTFQVLHCSQKFQILLFKEYFKMTPQVSYK